MVRSLTGEDEANEAEDARRIAVQEDAAAPNDMANERLTLFRLIVCHDGNITGLLQISLTYTYRMMPWKLSLTVHELSRPHNCHKTKIRQKQEVMETLQRGRCSTC